MKQFLELQTKYHDPINTFETLTISDDLKNTVDILKDIISKNMYTVNPTICFQDDHDKLMRRSYNNVPDTNKKLKSMLDDIDAETLKSIITDDTYVTSQLSWDQLMVDGKTDELVLKSLHTFFGTTELFYRIHRQVPGQITPLHYDRPKTDDLKPGHDVFKEKKAVIFFDDWINGQVFQVADQFLQWKACDIYTWSEIQVLHGTANFGFDDRLSLIVSYYKE